MAHLTQKYKEKAMQRVISESQAFLLYNCERFSGSRPPIAIAICTRIFSEKGSSIAQSDALEASIC